MERDVPKTPGASVATVAGATGLVGSELVRVLLAEPGGGAVRALVRRRPDGASLGAGAEPWGAVHVGAGVRFEPRAVDFETPESLRAALAGTDVLFCALGTTLRDAGSREAFRRVDHDYVLLLAELARDLGIGHLLVVSSLGADPRSRVFYSRVKGETERDLVALGLPRLTIARPSLLAGPRARPRPAEIVMQRLAFLVPARWRPVTGRQVALAMVAAARRPRSAGPDPSPAAPGTRDAGNDAGGGDTVEILDNSLIRGHVPARPGGDLRRPPRSR